MAQNYIAPLPSRWSVPVIKLLESGDPSKINWTFTAKQEMRLIGLATEQDAFQHCITTLKTTGTIGECIVGMRTSKGNILCESWAFLCPHPLGSHVPVYAKIGLHDNELSIDLFSLHIDRSGDLQEKINNSPYKP